MTSENGHCYKEKQFTKHEAEIERLKTAVNYNDDKLNSIEHKIDILIEDNHNNQMQSKNDDYLLDKRLIAIESELTTLWRVGALITVGLAMLDFYLKYLH